LDDHWMEIVRPDALSRLGDVRYAVFDFDGTISVIRQGWEHIMVPLMVEMICGDAGPMEAIEVEVREYVDRSTGVLTIKQMGWLAEAVRRHGLSGDPKTALEYKRIYNERLLTPVRRRLGQLSQGECTRDEYMVAGVRQFVEGLHTRGVELYLTSGTDEVYVLQEAAALGVDEFFEGRIFGARDDTEFYTKERIIQRILGENDLQGRQLLVVGDGPVEIRNAVAREALALGVASDEVRRCGWSLRKRRRLINAGADLLIADFRQHAHLLRFLCEARHAGCLKPHLEVEG
jgi:phosphoglycolate phosphatase-like HAD superfamily hydrolase